MQIKSIMIITCNIQGALSSLGLSMRRKEEPVDPFEDVSMEADKIIIACKIISSFPLSFIYFRNFDLRGFSRWHY